MDDEKEKPNRVIVGMTVDELAQTARQRGLVIPNRHTRRALAKLHRKNKLLEKKIEHLSKPKE